MSVIELPLYAITELLIRMSAFHAGLGEYHNHRIYQQYVLVRTTTGLLNMPKELVLKQVVAPQAIMNSELMQSAYTFRTR